MDDEADGYDHIRILLRHICGIANVQHPIGLTMNTGTMLLEHRLLHGDFTEEGFPEHRVGDEHGHVSDDLIEWLELAVSHVLRRQAWETQTTRSPASRRKPLWALLQHPVSRLAERLNRPNDHLDVLDLRMGPSMFSDGGEEVRFQSSATGSHLLLNGEYPESILDAMAGRPLIDVVGLPACGDPTLDAAVASVRIASAEQMPARVGNPNGPDAGLVMHWAVVRLEPVRWMPGTKPPKGRVVDWHVQHPFHA